MQHDRVDIRTSSASCGIVEVSRLSEEQDENLFAIANYFYHPARGSPPAFVLLSNLANEKTTSQELVARVYKLGFGEVMKTSPAINPKTAHAICCWLWNVDHQPFKDWYKTQRIKRLKEI